MTGKEKVLLYLRNCGGFGATADQITEATGVPQPARRINDLRNDGHMILGKYIDKARSIYHYKLLTDAGSPEPPDDGPSELFPTDTAAPKCAIDDDWQAA